jgi:hypothetical protein
MNACIAQGRQIVAQGPVRCTIVAQVPVRCIHKGSNSRIRCCSNSAKGAGHEKYTTQITSRRAFYLAAIAGASAALILLPSPALAAAVQPYQRVPNPLYQAFLDAFAATGFEVRVSRGVAPAK